MKISSGALKKALKVVIYGPEGIGKSTLAAQFPDPLFIDTEGSTSSMDVRRFDEKPSSWEYLKAQVKYVLDNPTVCKTLVIDTFDWAEALCVEMICKNAGKKGIEDFGYGNGYVYEKEEIGRFLNYLEEIINKNINVVLTAHAQIRKFEQPDEMGAYDRWELKLGKKTGSQISPLVKEWADVVFFANYKTFTVQADKDGKKHKAQGGQRVIYTSHHPCWDAKNRFGLPDEIPMDYNAFSHIIPFFDSGTISKPSTSRQVIDEVVKEAEKIDVETTAETDKPGFAIGEDIPSKALYDLMTENNVTGEDLRSVVAHQGYYPKNVPVAEYDSEFIDGVLVTAWPQVCAMIKDINSLPFNM